MELRQMATAFLSFQDRVLMMKKERSKIFDFEFWGGIGGHLEYTELNSPMEASYREIREETGFNRNDIQNFRLQYILIEKNDGEIRQQYVYFGETKHMDFNASDEGELFWVHKKELSNLHTSTLIKHTLNHYLHHYDARAIFVGTLSSNDESDTEIRWSTLEETGIF